MSSRGRLAILVGSLFFAPLLLDPSCGGTALAVTIDEARDFWRDFDRQTFDGIGSRVNEVYGVTNTTDPEQIARARRLEQKDVFNAFGTAAGPFIRNEIREAHGMAVPAAEQIEVNTLAQDLLTSGVMDRLSTLQLGIIKDHFSTNGNIDLGKFQSAVELFANGKLRTGAIGSREMDQLYQWFVWKQYARLAIAQNINKVEWEQILKSLEKGLEIYKEVYPARDPAVSGMLPLLDSRAERFRLQNQLPDDIIGALRRDIDGLTTDGVLSRERQVLKNVTPALGGAMRMPDRITVVRFDAVPIEQGYHVDFEVLLTDAQGMPVEDSSVGLIATDVGIEVTPERFFDEMLLTELRDGLYAAEFTAPVVINGLSLFAIDQTSLISTAVALPHVVSEPEILSLWVFAAPVLLGSLRRRSRFRGFGVPPIG